MTIAEFQTRLKKFSTDLIEKNRPFEIAVQSTTQKIGERIFITGETVSGSPIGSYNDTKPFYIDPLKSAGDTAALKPPRGKYGDQKFKNGKDHKTTFVSSYKDYRAKVKRQNTKVDLKLSGDLQLDLRNSKPNSPAKPHKVNALEYQIRLDRPINQKKAEGHDSKYGKIFGASEKEERHCNTIAQKEMLNQLTKYGLA